MEATAVRTCSIIAECPECNRAKRSIQLKRAVLVEELERDTDVRVASIVCGHDWSLSDLEKKNLRKALAEGLI
jgi:hypothetical protein